MGFEHYTYALTVNSPALKPQQYFINGFPQKWLERYLREGYFKVDPIVGHAERSTLPAIWSDKALDMKPVDLAAVVGRAQMFASLLHRAVSRIALPSLFPEQENSLTARERECIKWAAEGKTAWEIGQILGISERTAVFHLNNVIQKLGATNKTQAIVRAVALKLL